MEKDDIDRNLKFEIKKGKGPIKEFSDTGQLEFEGEYLNGKRYKGKGKMYISNGTFPFGKFEFEGEYLYKQIWNGKINKFVLMNILVYITYHLEENI